MSLGSPLLKSLCLVGLMGCGKTSVGERLAREWGVPFYDSDAEIERRTGKTVPQIFSEKGEKAFREIENEVILDLLKEKPGILSVGGGAFAQESLRKILLEKSTCVYLKTSPETLYDRVKGFTHRPLLQNPDPLETLKKLLSDREAFYMQCGQVIETDGLSLDEVAQKIL